jgi:tetratricopeptide (TPR) repeat protein
MQAVCDEEPAVSGLARDLDSILRKALDKDPARRYASADHLGDDLGRYLGGMPVRAAPPTLRYRMAKYVRRNWKLVSALAALGLSLTGGVITTLWQARTANEQRALAERRLRDARKLSGALVADVQGALRNIPGTLGARQLILQRAVEYLDHAAGDGTTDPSMQADLADAYDAAAEWTFDVQSAGALHRRALAMRETLAASDPANPGYAAAVAESLQQVARNDRESGRTSSSIANHRRAVSILESLAARSPGAVAVERQLAESYAVFGQILLIAGHRPEARKYLARYGERVESLYAREPNNLETLQQRFVAQDAQAIVSSELGEHKKAIEHARRNLAWCLELLKSHPNSSTFLRDRWVAQDRVGLMLLRAGGHAPEAVQSIEQGLATLRELIQLDPTDSGHQRALAVSNRRLGDALESAGRPKDALAAYDRAAQISQGLLARDPAKLETLKDLAIVKAHRGALLYRAGRLKEAEESMAQALPHFEAAHSRDPEDAMITAAFAAALHDFGIVLQTRGVPHLNRAKDLWSQLAASGTLGALDRDRPALTVRALASLKLSPASAASASRP